MPAETRVSGFALRFLHPPFSEPLFQHLGGAACKAVAADGGATARQGLPLHLLHRGDLAAPARSARRLRLFAQLLGNAVSFGFRLASADDDLVALALGTGIIAIDDQVEDLLRRLGTGRAPKVSGTSATAARERAGKRRIDPYSFFVPCPAVRIVRLPTALFSRRRRPALAVTAAAAFPVARLPPRLAAVAGQPASFPRQQPAPRSPCCPRRW